MAWWYVFLLAAAGGVAYAIWNFRKTTAARKAASVARFEKMFKGSAQPAVDPQPAAPSGDSASVSPAPTKAPATPPAASLKATERFLGQAESLLYYLLKAGLPDREVFAGVGFKFNDFIQSIHRVQRFGQTQPVRVDIVHTEAEREVLATLKEKWARHDEMQAKMAEIIRTYGLSQLAMQDTLARTIGFLVRVSAITRTLP